jgi:DNA-binding transcriptional ArsR family regulator
MLAGTKLMRSFNFEVDKASEFLDALANPVRLEIVRMLVEGEVAVTTIAVRLGMSQSAVSQHLRKLRDAAVVRTRRNGTMIFYSLPQHSNIPLFLDFVNEAIEVMEVPEVKHRTPLARRPRLEARRRRVVAEV